MGVRRESEPATVNSGPLTAASLLILIVAGVGADLTLSRSAEAPGVAPIAYEYGENKCCGYDTAGKVRATVKLDQRTCSFLIAGQSNVGNNVSEKYTPRHRGKVFNWNYYDGLLYEAIDPLLGTAVDGPARGGGNFAGRLADKLIDGDHCTQVILAPIAIAGSQIGTWATGPGQQRMPTAVSRMRAVNLPTTAVLWGQGESDPNSSAGYYTTAMRSIISGAQRAGLDPNVPWYVARQTYVKSQLIPAVREAQATMADGKTIFPGPDADTLGKEYRQPDDIHFNAKGADAYANLWRDALTKR